MKRWSRNHDCCISCHSTERRHVGKGLCKLCWSRQWLSENLDRLREYKHQWWESHGGKELSRLKREQRNYSGRREAILKRDGYTCQKCGSTHQLLVHHVDGNGRGHPHPNNSIDNLVTWCRKCHCGHHSKLSRWSRNHERCVKCGRVDRRHWAKGKCIACYHEEQFKKHKSRRVWDKQTRKYHLLPK